MGGQALISELNHFDLFLTGGTILTGNPGQPEIRDGSIGVLDGKRTWLGHGTPQSGHTTKRVLKLAGCVVTPGFVNTHTHSFLTIVRGVAVDAGFAPSYTLGIPKGPELNPDQARAFARRTRRPDDHVGGCHGVPDRLKRFQAPLARGVKPSSRLPPARCGARRCDRIGANRRYAGSCSRRRGRGLRVDQPLSTGRPSA